MARQRVPAPTAPSCSRSKTAQPALRSSSSAAGTTSASRLPTDGARSRPPAPASTSRRPGQLHVHRLHHHRRISSAPAALGAAGSPVSRSSSPKPQQTITRRPRSPASTRSCRSTGRRRSGPSASFGALEHADHDPRSACAFRSTEAFRADCSSGLRRSSARGADWQEEHAGVTTRSTSTGTASRQLRT